MFDWSLFNALKWFFMCAFSPICQQQLSKITRWDFINPKYYFFASKLSASKNTELVDYYFIGYNLASTAEQQLSSSHEWIITKTPKNLSLSLSAHSKFSSCFSIIPPFSSRTNRRECEEKISQTEAWRVRLDCVSEHHHHH